ncbi:MAG: PD-(D/E)XK nuclease family protein [Candidatus Omnitrophica bacterium]|nr:PD-(D/E)XK nuclease family protein [Candidatus Omnitrophota bacterium]
MYLRCPAQYYFRYVENLKMPPGLALTFGKSIDSGLNLNYNQKKETFKDLKVDLMIDAYEQTYDTEIKNTLLTEDDDPKKTREQGIKLIKEYHKNISPTVQPLQVQEKIEVDFEDFDYKLLVVPDLITIEENIIDNKTSSHSPPQENGIYRPSSFEHYLQLVADNFAFLSKYKKESENLRIDYLVKTKTPKVVTVNFKPQKEDNVFFLNILGRIADAIKNNIFYPNRNCMTCSYKFCGYAKLCEAQFGGKVKEK